MASSVEGDGTVHWSFDCSLGDLTVTSMADGKRIEIAGQTDRDDCGLLTNRAFADAANSDEVGPAQASVSVRCPSVAIDRSTTRPMRSCRVRWCRTR